MRFFTDDAEGDDGEWERRVAAYSEHLRSLKGQLTDDVRALATDPRLDLHDGRLVAVDVDQTACRISMVVDAGSLEMGYRRLSLTFHDSELVPDDLQSLAEAVGASFRPNHWHQGTAVTEIRWQEVDIRRDGRFVLRLRLWPFYEFAIHFGAFSHASEPLAYRPAPRPGRFTFRA